MTISSPILSSCLRFILGNDRVTVYSPTGAWIRTIGRAGKEPGQFSSPSGIAVDTEGDIFVIDYVHRVQVFTETGEFKRCFGTRGHSPGQLYFAWGITVDRNGHVIVVDSYNHRCQIFSKEGQFLVELGPERGKKNGHFEYPKGCGIDAKGRLFITDDTPRIQLFG